jgi:hypothetical protein
VVVGLVVVVVVVVRRVVVVVGIFHILSVGLLEVGLIAGPYYVTQSVHFVRSEGLGEIRQYNKKRRKNLKVN